MQTLIRKQQLNCTIQEAWNFFSHPENLQKITPKEMNFIIKTKNLSKMYAGQIIEYSVSPIFNIPLTWVTEITQVVENKYFIDNQLVGPYKIWHHQHFFEENEKGVLLTDIVNYKIGFGFLGTILEKFFINKKVSSIFNFRNNFIKNNFKK